MDAQKIDVINSVQARADEVQSSSTNSNQASSFNSFWAPWTSFFTSRDTEVQNPSTPSKPIATPAAIVNAIPPPTPSISYPPSIASKFLSSLASVFGVRGVQGAIHVGFDVTSPAFGSSTHTISSHYSFDIVEAVQHLDPHIQDRIVAYLVGNGIPKPTPSHSPGPKPSVQVDEGFVYVEENHSGMQTDTGSYVLYGHVAISADLHQQLLATGIRPSQLQESLDMHDSDPDKAIDWLIGKQSSREVKELETRVSTLQLTSQPPFDLQLSEVPLFLTKMKSLVSLELSHHSLTTIPTYLLFSLPSLEILKLRSNRLKYFLTSAERPVPIASSPPPFFSRISNDKQQQSLHMTTPPVGAPTSGSQLTSNSHASVDDDDLESWKYQDHEAMVTRWGAPKLRHLDLSGNALTSLPSSISILSNLTYCNLSNNYLKYLPEEILLLPLETMLLSQNQVYDIPIPSSNWAPGSSRMQSSLTNLSLDNNNIKPALLSLNSRTVLQNLASFKSLKSISVSHNTISPIPYSILEIASSIAELDLSNDNLRTLTPQEIKAFINLTKLNLSSNGLKTLPSELFSLAQLEDLNISNNELTALPHGLPGLGFSLRHLNIAHNRLKSLPGSICTLVNLASLDISGNQLNDLILDSIAQLTALKRLDLGGNVLTKFPSSLSTLCNLTFLSLHTNPLLQVNALPHYGKLEELDIRETPTLVSLPKLASELSELKILHVAHVTLTLEVKRQKRRALTSVPKKRDRAIGHMQRHVSVLVHNSEQLGLVQLISLIRSCPHELLLGGMAQLCMDSNWHSKLLQAGLVNELAVLLFSSEIPAAQVRTLKAIQTLCKNPGNHRFIGVDKQIIGCLKEIIQDNLALVSSDVRANLLIRLALDAFSYLSYDPAIRRMINLEPTSQSLATILSRAKTLLASQGPSKDADHYSASAINSLEHLEHDYGLCSMIRHLSTMKDDKQVYLRAKRAMSGLGLIPPILPVKRPRGIRVLSIDGGGTRGFIVLHMLAVLEALTGKKISDLFDLIVGTSTGGMITGLAAWSPIPMEEAKPFYKIMCKTVFTPKGQTVIPPSESVRTNGPTPVPPLFGGDEEDDLVHRVYSSTDVLSSLGSSDALRNSQGLSDSASEVGRPLDASIDDSASNTTHSTTSSKAGRTSPLGGDNSDPSHPAESRWLSSAPWQKFTGLISMIQTRSYYETGPIESILKEMAGEQVSMLDTAMMSDTKFALVCTRVNLHPPQPYILRNYNHPTETKSALDGNSTFRVWEAIRATSAAPGYFDPVIKDDLHLVDGAMLFNNPVALAISEARNLWPESDISCVVSCGTGSRPFKPVEVSMGQLLSAIVDSATETEKTALLASSALPKGSYFRLQPCGEVFDFPIDETRYERFDEMEQFMKKWIEANGSVFAEIVSALTKEG